MSWLSSALGLDQAKNLGTQSTELQDQAIKDAKARQASLAPYQDMALANLTGNKAPDLSSVYGGGPQYTPLHDPLLDQANAATGKSLSSLTDSPDYMAQADQALQNYDTQAAPQ